MIKQYKHRGKTYYAIQLSFTDKTGKRHQTKFRKDKLGNRITSERKARELETESILRLKANDEDDYYFTTFGEWHTKFLDSIKLTHKRGTIAQYDGDLRKWLHSEFMNRRLKDLKRNHIHTLIFEKLPLLGATPNTQKRILRNVRRILEAAVEEGAIGQNPCSGIRVKSPAPKKLVLNTEEAETLLREARTCCHEFYHVWAFALLTGMRSGEMFGLRWRDIDEVTGNIHVSKQWTNKDGYHSTKSNKNRVLPISPELKVLLGELKQMGPFKASLDGLDGSSHSFEDLVLPRISEWKYGNASLVTREFCRRIGITQVKFHDLRATFVTNLLARGVSLAKVMALAGHSKTSTTDEYVRLAGVDVKGSTEMLGYSLPTRNRSQVVLKLM